MFRWQEQGSGHPQSIRKTLPLRPFNGAGAFTCRKSPQHEIFLYLDNLRIFLSGCKSQGAILSKGRKVAWAKKKPVLRHLVQHTTWKIEGVRCLEKVLGILMGGAG